MFCDILHFKVTQVTQVTYCYGSGAGVLMLGRGYITVVIVKIHYLKKKFSLPLDIHVDQKILFCLPKF